MTREERQYFYNSLQKMFAEWVVEHEDESIYLNSKNLMSFADRYMQTITGQQPLPQAVFRLFLEEYTPVLKGVDSKQDKVDDGLETKDTSVVGAINEVRGMIIASGGNTEATKEVVEVESEEALYTLENPSKEVIYITADTGMLYIYDGNSFTNVTNQEVDNTIYVTNINELLNQKYTKAGLYTSIEVFNNISTTYSLNVPMRTSQSGGAYFLKLANNDGWAEVATKEDGEKYWKWHNYTYQEDIDALLPLIYAGL